LDRTLESGPARTSSSSLLLEQVRLEGGELRVTDNGVPDGRARGARDKDQNLHRISPK
jgi:hypothetical protein